LKVSSIEKHDSKRKSVIDRLRLSNSLATYFLSYIEKDKNHPTR